MSRLKRLIGRSDERATRTPHLTALGRAPGTTPAAAGQFGCHPATNTTADASLPQTRAQPTAAGGRPIAATTTSREASVCDHRLPLLLDPVRSAAEGQERLPIVR